MKRFMIALLGGVSLSGCMVGPKYVAPLSDAPAQAAFTGSDAASFAGEEPPVEWWKLFNAPVLDQLVAEALEKNTDLRVAEANLKQARAVLSETRTARLPSTTASGSGRYGQIAGAQFGMEGAGRRGETFDVGMDVNYQVDLFGRIGRAIQAGRADMEATRAARDLTRVTVAAEVTRAYVDACGLGQQLAVARETLRVQERTFDLTRRIFEGGRGTALDTSRAAALLEQTRAEVPSLEAERQAALYRLATLTGRVPTDFPAEVGACATVPVLNSVIPVGNGATLLARRPDIRAAERRLAAATARVGVATADLYPSISLGGSIGSSALALKDVGSSSGLRFSIGPLISWSFPNIAVAKARIRQAEAGAEGALASFDGAWLRALQETESALTRYAGAADRVEAFSRAQAQSAEAARIARLRYQSGAESFQVVLDSERALAQAEAQLASARSAYSGQAVVLFLALGGGWQLPEPATN